MFFHVLENTMRNGVKGYLHVKTYKNHKALEKWLQKTGHSVWVVGDNQAKFAPPSYNTTLIFKADCWTYGGFTASYWNTGGWGLAVMPKLPMLTGRSWLK